VLARRFSTSSTITAVTLKFPRRAASRPATRHRVQGPAQFQVRPRRPGSARLSLRWSARDGSCQLQVGASAPPGRRMTWPADPAVAALGRVAMRGDRRSARRRSGITRRPAPPACRPQFVRGERCGHVPPADGAPAPPLVQHRTFCTSLAGPWRRSCIRWPSRFPASRVEQPHPGGPPHLAAAGLEPQVER